MIAQMLWPVAAQQQFGAEEAFVPAPSGLYLPESIAKTRLRRPTAIDLFSGAGGFSLGLIMAGFEVLAGLDNDPACAVTYMMNLGGQPCEFHFAEPADKDRLNAFLERQWKKRGQLLVIDCVAGSGWIRANPWAPPVRHFFFGDARKFTGEQILDALGLKPGEVDCVVGGPPCQGFSTMGKRQVMDPRNSLVFEFARLVLEIRPKAFIFENVPGILSMVTPEGIPVIDAFCMVLEEGGFSTFESLKRALLATSGAGAGVRGRPPSVKHEKRVKTEPAKQLDFFEEAIV